MRSLWLGMLLALTVLTPAGAQPEEQYITVQTLLSLCDNPVGSAAHMLCRTSGAAIRNGRTK